MDSETVNLVKFMEKIQDDVRILVYMFAKFHVDQWISSYAK